MSEEDDELKNIRRENLRHKKCKKRDSLRDFDRNLKLKKAFKQRKNNILEEEYWDELEEYGEY